MTFDWQCDVYNPASINNATSAVILSWLGWHIDEDMLSLAEWCVTTQYEAVS